MALRLATRRTARLAPAVMARALSAAAGGASPPKVKTLKERPLEDKSQISPVRGFFYGTLEPAVRRALPFPQALDADAKGTLKDMLDPIQGVMAGLPSADMDEKHAIPKEVMASLAELGLFGLQIPESLGGLGLSNTAYARVAEELVLDASVAVTLMAHQSIGLKGILLCGTEAQKAKFLPKLASGEHVAAFALTEPGTGSDAAGIKCSAVPAERNGVKGFEISGEKMWISNGGIADVFTLFARTTAPDGSSKITAFIVEKGPGLTPGQPEKKLGIRASNTVQLHLDKVFVPEENVLGELHGGFKVAMQILNNGRFGMGAATGGGIRRLITLAGEYANQRPAFGLPIAKFGLIQQKFADMAARAYAIEAMSYATTALIDRDALDMSVEAAICKVYGSESMWHCVNEAIQTLGGMGFAAGGAYPFERWMRDARILLIFEGTNEILRLFIGLTCMQGVGAELSAAAKAPLANLRRLLVAQAGAKWGLELPLPGGGAAAGASELLSKVHPDLKDEAKALARAVGAFSRAVDTLLVRHGKTIAAPEHQLAVARIADSAIHLFGWFAVCSRYTQAAAAPGADAATLRHELSLAKLWIDRAARKVGDDLSDVMDGEQAAGDAAVYRVAQEMLEGPDGPKYLAKHPLGVDA